MFACRENGEGRCTCKSEEVWTPAILSWLVVTRVSLATENWAAKLHQSPARRSGLCDDRFSPGWLAIKDVLVYGRGVKYCVHVTGGM